MNPLLINLLSTLTGANTIQGNPDYNDPNAKTYRQPYVDPSFWTRLLSPETASYENQSNISSSQAQAREQQQHDIAQTIKAGDFSKVQNSTTTPLSGLTPAQGAVLFPQGGTAPELNQWNQSTPRNILGLPSQEATTEYQEGANKSRQLARESTLGLPETTAWQNYTGSLAGGSGNVNRNLYNNLIQSYIPTEAASEGVGAQNQLGLNLGTQKALPDIIRKTLNEAMLGAKLSDVDLTNSPALANTRQNQIREAARESSYPSTMQNPLFVAPGGKVARNPYYGGMMSTINAKMSDMNGGGNSFTPIGNGLNIGPASEPSMDTGTKQSTMPARTLRTPIEVPQTNDVPVSSAISGGVNPLVFAGANNQPGTNDISGILKNAGPKVKRALLNALNMLNEAQGGTGKFNTK